MHAEPIDVRFRWFFTLPLKYYAPRTAKHVIGTQEYTCIRLKNSLLTQLMQYVNERGSQGFTVGLVLFKLCIRFFIDHCKANVNTIAKIGF